MSFSNDNIISVSPMNWKKAPFIPVLHNLLFWQFSGKKLSLFILKTGFYTYWRIYRFSISKEKGVSVADSPVFLYSSPRSSFSEEILWMISSIRFASWRLSSIRKCSSGTLCSYPGFGEGVNLLLLVFCQNTHRPF